MTNKTREEAREKVLVPVKRQVRQLEAEVGQRNIKELPDNWREQSTPRRWRI